MKYLLSFILFFAACHADSRDKRLLHFTISRPYCVINFLETSKGVYGTSGALKKYIEANTKDDEAFQQLVSDYTALDLDIMYQRNGFPASRPSYRSTKDLLIIAAVQSQDLASFRGRIAGILHNGDEAQLMRILHAADVYYERIIWSRHGAAAMSQLKSMQQFEASANEAFLKMRTLYQTQWPDDMPFTVALTPVPGKEGDTAATPHANSLCVDILTEETAYAERAAIVMHEIAHVLYAEQSREMQQHLENWFQSDPSPMAAAAHNFFDEGMATAVGNGWVYQYLTGKMDPAGWYSNEYIDGFGHALFPLVNRYIVEGRGVDANFVKEAVRLFGERFPNAPNDYGVQLNHLTLHANEEEPVARNQVRQDLYQEFAVTWLNLTTPILGAESKPLLETGEGAQLIVINQRHQEVLEALMTTLPELRQIKVNPAENFVINFFDRRGRMIIIGGAHSGTAALFKALKARKQMTAGENSWVYAN